MKPKLKRSVEVEEDYEEEEEQEEETDEEMEKEIEELEAKEQVKKPIAPQVKKSFSKSEPRFLPFAQQSSEGVYDSKTNQPIARTQWEMMALIYSELIIIKETLGDMTK